jgi:DNA (cytosine-5)-methyltransferase 1
MDSRGTLFFEIARILKDKRPRYFLLENVAGLLSHDDRRTFVRIIGILADIGYRVQWQVLNSKDYGVPQNRERVFIIGSSGEEPRPEVFPVSEGNGEDRHSVVSTALDANYGHGIDNHSQRTVIIQKHQENMGDNFPMVQAVNTKQVGNARFSAECPTLGENDYKEPKMVSVDSRIRRLTPIECERLQGFPDCWTEYGIDEKGNKIKISDTQRYKCLGNAVTTNVITRIMSKWNV